MVGGTRRADPVVISNTNVFAALDTLKKKKKLSASDKEQHISSKANSREKDPKKEFFWAPTPLTAKSWADVEEEDDDYYATTANLASAWGVPEDVKTEEQATEDNDTDEGADFIDDIEDHENEIVHEEPVEYDNADVQLDVPLVHKDAERQLSKKELKKKGLEELDAVLAELGCLKPEIGTHDNPHVEKGAGRTEVKKANEEPKKEGTAGEGKGAKKKKKKERSKEVKESDAADVVVAVTEAEKLEDSTQLDVKERLKKVASSKKKKPSVKEIDAAARAAASEAAARSAKLAAAKKKEKTHYNQQPVR